MQRLSVEGLVTVPFVARREIDAEDNSKTIEIETRVQFLADLIPCSREEKMSTSSFDIPRTSVVDRVKLVEEDQPDS